MYYGLLGDAVSSSDYIQLDDKICNKQANELENLCGSNRGIF